MNPLVSSALSIFLITAAHAVQPFGHIIRKNDAALPAFTTAGMATHEGIPGAAFYAGMDFPNGASTYPVTGFGYFDQNAVFKWAAYLETGPLAGYYPTISGPLISNPAKYFTIYNVPGGKTRVGVGTGSALAKDFAYEFSHAANPDDTTTGLAPGDKIYELIDEGSTLGLVSFNPNGTLAVSKNYSSPLLLPAVPAGQNDPQFTHITPILDGSGYYLTVQNSSNGLTNTFLIINIDAAGAVRWAQSFQMTGSSPNSITHSPSFQPAPDGSYIFTLGEAGFDLATFTYKQKTHLIKFNANGTKAWATTLSGASLMVNAYSPNSNDVWLTGSKSDVFATPPSTQPVIARLNNATGQVAAEFRPGISAGLSAYTSMVEVNAEAAYFDVRDGNMPNRSFIAKVPVGANEAQLFLRNDTFSSGANLSMRDTTGALSSEFGDGLRVIGYNPSFQSVIPACPDYSGALASWLSPGLTAAALTIDPQTTTITVAARSTTLTPITLPIHALALKIDPYQTPAAPLKLAVTTSRSAAGHLLLSFTGQAGVQYTLLYSPDLKTAFQPVQTLNGSGGTATFTVTNLSAPKGFFKISDGAP
jgi:hypothetical protein